MRFEPKLKTENYKILFAVNVATVHFIRKGSKYIIKVRGGKLNIWKLQFIKSALKSKSPKVSIAGTVIKPTITGDADKILINFGKMYTIEVSQSIEII